MRLQESYRKAIVSAAPTTLLDKSSRKTQSDRRQCDATQWSNLPPLVAPENENCFDRRSLSLTLCFSLSTEIHASVIKDTGSGIRIDANVHDRNGPSAYLIGRKRFVTLMPSISALSAARNCQCRTGVKCASSITLCYYIIIKRDVSFIKNSRRNTRTRPAGRRFYRAQRAIETRILYVYVGTRVLREVLSVVYRVPL